MIVLTDFLIISCSPYSCLPVSVHNILYHKCDYLYGSDE